MDPLQKQAINNSSDYLRENTTATIQVSTILLSRGRMTNIENQLIFDKGITFLQNIALYNHILTQKGAWDDLLFALRSTCNEHVASRLEQELQKLKTSEKPKQHAEKSVNNECAPSSQSSSVQAKEKPGPSNAHVNASNAEGQGDGPLLSKCIGPTQKKEADRDPTNENEGPAPSNSEPPKVYQLGKGAIGVVFVINMEFTGTADEREGSEKDVKDIEAMFNGHRVIVWRNRTKNELEEELDTVRGRVQKNKDYSFCVVIYMSHGRADNILCTNDNQEIHLYDDLIYKFNHKSIPELKGKPKIFLIQACSGNRAEDMDGPLFGDYIRNSEMEDTFIGRACRPSRGAHRNHEHGAIYIQAILEIFQSHWQLEDLETLHKRVEVLVKNNWKQTPEGIPWIFGSFKFPFLFQGSL